MTLKHYGLALSLGSQFIYHSMPRLLSLWLDYSATTTNVRAASSHNQRSACTGDSATFAEIQELMLHNKQRIPAYQFYTALGQILSRLCHEHPEIVLMLTDLVVRIFIAYPQQTI
ncbi:unnamed protein product [Protopolystoma xenopodis]|uniref:FAT domain-containing protein n=1 Tax=Protopolystoma xenopodis TaxID=117903 RepID=A0A448WLV5_9PLAT|nr:unnamed protein product [Protopolystoma xenopodis]